MVAVEFTVQVAVFVEITVYVKNSSLGGSRIFCNGSSSSIGNHRGFYVCLFVWNFSSHSRNFHLFGDVTIAGEGLHILTYARHLWPLSSEGSLACHNYCDTGHPFIMIISEDPWHCTLCQAFGSEAVTTFFNDFCLSQLGFENPTFRLWGELFNTLHLRLGITGVEIAIIDFHLIDIHVFILRLCYQQFFFIILFFLSIS